MKDQISLDVKVKITRRLPKPPDRSIAAANSEVNFNSAVDADSNSVVLLKLVYSEVPSDNTSNHYSCLLQAPPPTPGKFFNLMEQPATEKQVSGMLRHGFSPGFIGPKLKLRIDALHSRKLLLLGECMLERTAREVWLILVQLTSKIVVGVMSQGQGAFGSIVTQFILKPNFYMVIVECEHWLGNLSMLYSPMNFVYDRGKIWLMQKMVKRFLVLAMIGRNMEKDISSMEDITHGFVTLLDNGIKKVCVMLLGKGEMEAMDSCVTPNLHNIIFASLTSESMQKTMKGKYSMKFDFGGIGYSFFFFPRRLYDSNNGIRVVFCSFKESTCMGISLQNKNWRSSS